MHYCQSYFQIRIVKHFCKIKNFVYHFSEAAKENNSIRHPIWTRVSWTSSCIGKISQCKFLASFFFIVIFLSAFFSQTFTIHRTPGKEDSISLIPPYHLNPHYKHLEIRQAIVTANIPLQRASNQTWTGNLWFQNPSCQSLSFTKVLNRDMTISI